MEPERPIEKLLRGMAKKRREQTGGPLELSPTARRRLQQEVARRAPARSGGGFWSGLFSGFIPKLAFALCVLAIGGIGLWMFLPRGEKQNPATLAMNGNFERARATAHRQIASPPPASVPPLTPAGEQDSTPTPAAPAAPPSVAMEDRLQSKPTVEPGVITAAKGNMAQAASAASEAAPLPQPVNAPAQFFDNERRSGSLASASSLDKDTTANSFAVAPPQATNAVTSDVALAAAEPEAQKKLGAPGSSVAFKSNRAAVSDGLVTVQTAAPARQVSQRFTRKLIATSPHDAGSITGPAVLTSFQVVQNGQEIRVVDADGSVYTGSFIAAPANRPQVAKAFWNGFAPGTTGAAKAELPAQPPSDSSISGTIPASNRSAAPAYRIAGVESPALSPQSYFFRVIGTNRYLGQRIVFSGNLIPLSTIPASRTNAAAFEGTAHYDSGIPDSSVILNSRISGKAKIGGQKEIEVNATPAR